MFCRTSKFYVSHRHQHACRQLTVRFLCFVQGPSITTLRSPVAKMLEEYLALEGRLPGGCSFDFTDRDPAVNRADIDYL